MNRNFGFPVILLLAIGVPMAVSGMFPVSLGLLFVAAAGVLYLLSRMREETFNYAMTWAIMAIASFAVIVIYIGLMKLEIFFPWLRTVLLWPLKP